MGALKAPQRPGRSSPPATLAPVHLLAFLSGISALIQEVVDTRLLARSFGLTVEAAAVAATIFLGGLAIGAAVARRWTMARPLRTLVWLEGSIAAFAYASPLLFAGYDAGQAMLRDAAGVSRTPGILLAGLLAAVLLAAPTIAMGATFPAFLAVLRARQPREGAGPRSLASAVALLYGANTLGAVGGTLAAGFVLLPWIGVIGALHAAAGISVLVAWGSWILDGKAGGREIPDPGAATLASSSAPATPTSGARSPRKDEAALPGLGRWMGAVALLGAGMLALEVLLTRILIQLLGASTYAFTLVLAAVLLGTGLGAILLGPAGTNRPGALPAADRFVLFAVLAAMAAPLGVWLLRAVAGVPDVLDGLALRTVAGETFPRFVLREGLLSVAAIGPPFVFSGAALPAAIHAASAGRFGVLPRRGAMLYAANTAGAVLGGPLAAFFLLPRFGLAGSILAAAAFALLAGGTASSRRVSSLARAGIVAAGLLLVLALLQGGRSHGANAAPALFEVQGPTAAVRVEEFAVPGGGSARNLRVNGKVVAGTELLDRRLQIGMGFLPVALHPAPRRALVVGLGTGLTAGAVALAQDVTSIDVVEISPEVVRAEAWFEEENGHVLADPRVHLTVDDARQWLRFTDRRFDLVTSDPIHPWVAGSGSLYTLEYFRLVASRLREGGLVAQWIPLYQLGREDVRCILATFGAVFPQRSLWLLGTDLVVLGSLGPRPGEVRRFEELFGEAATREALGRACLASPALLLATFVAGETRVQQWTGTTPPLHRDLRPILEFRAARRLGGGYALDVMGDLLGQAPEPPAPGVGLVGILAAPPASLAATTAAVRAAARRFLDDLRRGPADRARATFVAELRRIAG